MKVYRVRQGKIQTGEVVRKTPKGYRVSIPGRKAVLEEFWHENGGGRSRMLFGPEGEEWWTDMALTDLYSAKFIAKWYLFQQVKQAEKALISAKEDYHAAVDKFDLMQE